MRSPFCRTLTTVFLVLLFALVLPCMAKNRLTVRAVGFKSQVNDNPYTITTPGESNTNCSGTATTWGNTTNASANCRTTSTPAETAQRTWRTVDVVNWVEANGMRYTLACTAKWRWNVCLTLRKGELFQAEIDKNTMWVVARKGGNQGKQVRIKYTILDIRPSPTN
jgi:putative salt-induced outer membrane protein YdiY